MQPPLRYRESRTPRKSVLPQHRPAVFYLIRKYQNSPRTGAGIGDAEQKCFCIKEHESFFDGLSDIDGLKRERTEQQMRDAIAKGTLMKDLQWVPVKKDDLFFIEAGTIHAIGAGALVAEIQENSNLTYRLYDYDRVGKDGKKRELHIGTKTDVTRLISARMATEFERGLYYGKNE